MPKKPSPFQVVVDNTGSMQVNEAEAIVKIIYFAHSGLQALVSEANAQTSFPNTERIKRELKKPSYQKAELERFQTKWFLEVYENDARLKRFLTFALEQMSDKTAPMHIPLTIDGGMQIGWTALFLTLFRQLDPDAKARAFILDVAVDVQFKHRQAAIELARLYVK